MIFRHLLRRFVPGLSSLAIVMWLLLSAESNGQEASTPQEATDLEQRLHIPALSDGAPRAGQRVRVHAAEFVGTGVFHTVYLPSGWKQDGERLPIVFEYTGNRHIQSGSTGEPEGAGLGFGISGGRAIWVSLPYINAEGDDNETLWWGDLAATVQYAKEQVPQIIEDYHADPDRVVLCGFSRGAIGVNLIGLHDDAISSLWTAFVTHDHFDGVREWRGTDWGTPLGPYQERAQHRLNRVAGRPYLVIQEGSVRRSEEFVNDSLSSTENFTFLAIDPEAIQGSFPNEHAKSSHNDRWLLLPSDDRQLVWNWLKAALEPSAQDDN